MITPQDVEKVKYGMAFWLKRWYRDPLSYVIECIGDIPTHQQAEILKAFQHHNFVAVKSGHGIGKTRLEGWIANWWLDTRALRVPITGPAADQLNNVVWPEVVDTSKRKWPWLSNQYEATSEELRYKAQPEFWRAILRTARQDNNDALQGFHRVLFILDEGSGIRDKIFEVAEGAFGDPENYALMMGNPTQLSGYMYNIFHQKSYWYTLSFSSENTLTDTEYHYTYIDPHGDIKRISCHGRQTREWIQNMREKYGLASNVYRVRVMGEFANVGSDQLIEERWVANCFQNGKGISSGSLDNADRTFKRRMGIDPAWTGEDDTGVVIREGDKILHAESWHGFDLVESFNRLKVLWDEWKVDVGLIDTVGEGAGLYDMFRHANYRGNLGYPVIKVHCSERAPEDKDGDCKTLRDWLWWKSRKFFRTKVVKFAGLPEDKAWKQLKHELLAPTYKIMSGKVVAESKDEMKKRGLRSPNLADALNTTFFQDYETFKESYTYAPEREQRNKKRKKSVRSWKTR